MLQALALWATMGLLLNAVGFTIDSWQFWSFLGLFWCVERIGRVHGAAEGIIKFLAMSDSEQERIRKLIKEMNND
jgi:hypothetical protein